MAWSLVKAQDRHKLLAVIEQAITSARGLGLPASSQADPYWAVGMILSGAVEAAWIDDHTLFVFKASNFTWYAKHCRTLQELLVFKYDGTPRATFRRTVAAMQQIAASRCAEYLVVGNTLTPHPDRVRNLYLRHGFYQNGGQLIKEIYEQRS